MNPTKKSGPTPGSGSGSSAIADRTKTSLQTFDNILDCAAANADAKDAVLDNLSRFRIWAGNIGAYHVDSRSADYRVREAPEIAERIIELLEEVIETNEEIRAIVSGEREDAAVADADEDESMLDGDGQTELSELCLATGDTISSLLKVSGLLRKATGRDRYAKAAASKDDPFLEDVDIRHVAEKFPKLEQKPWLRDRLGKANVQRRQYLRYARKHHDRLAHEPADFAKSAIAPSRFEGTSGLPGVHPKTIVSSRPTLAHTDASTLLVDLLPPAQGQDIEHLDDTLSQATSVVTSRADHHNDAELDVIRLSELTKDGEPFECPYCWSIVQTKRQKSWRKHVLRDIRAWACTFEHCNSGLFEDRDAWFQHELDAHRRLWACQSCPDAVFPSAAAMSAHVKKTHRGQSADTLEAIVNASSRPMTEVPASACALCNEWEERLERKAADLGLSSEHVIAAPLDDFRRHVSNHLEQLALFSIPPTLERLLESDSRKGTNGAHSAKHDPEGLRQWRDEIGEEPDLEETTANSLQQNQEDQGLSLIKQGEGCEDAAAGLHKFRKSLPRHAVRITAIISELFAISSALRTIHHDDVLPQIQEDVKLLSRSLNETLSWLFNMFAGSRARPDYLVWEELNTLFEQEEHCGLLDRLEWYRDFLTALHDASGGQERADVGDLRQKITSLLQLQEQHALPPYEEPATSTNLDNTVAEPEPEPEPIMFTDAIGRKFSFPWHLCQTWKGMEDLVKQAFLHVDGLNQFVRQGRYDLIDPERQIILPANWSAVIRPGWTIEMQMWPMEASPESNNDHFERAALPDPFANTDVPGLYMISNLGFDIDGAGQEPVQGIKNIENVTLSLWEDEGTVCFIVDVDGFLVARRDDNNMINGTTLLKVAGMARDRRDGILKQEKIRHVVKVGSLQFKGVWIPFERALEFANREKITERLYPLFVDNLRSLSFLDRGDTRPMPSEEGVAQAVPAVHDDSGDWLMVDYHDPIERLTNSTYVKDLDPVEPDNETSFYVRDIESNGDLLEALGYKPRLLEGPQPRLVLLERLQRERNIDMFERDRPSANERATADDLLWACGTENLERLKFLHQKSPSLFPKVRDAFGNTLLHIAALNGHHDILEYVVRVFQDVGADITSRNVEGEQPLDLISNTRGDTDGIRSLLQDAMSRKNRIDPPTTTQTFEQRQLATDSEAASYHTAATVLDESSEDFESLAQAQILSLADDDLERLETEYRLGSWYLQQRRPQEAVHVLAHAVRFRRRISSRTDPNTIAAVHLLADAYCASEQAPAAIQELENTLKAGDLQGQDKTKMIGTMLKLGQTHRENNDLEKAISTFRQVVELQSASIGSDHPETYLSRCELALAYEESGRIDDAMEELQQILTFQWERLGPEHSDTIRSQHLLVGVYLRDGRVEEAKVLLETAIRVQTAVLAPNSPELLNTKVLLARVHVAKRQPAQGVALLEEVVSLEEREFPPDHPRLLRSRTELLKAYGANGQVHEAEALRRRLFPVQDSSTELATRPSPQGREIRPKPILSGSSLYAQPSPTETPSERKRGRPAEAEVFANAEAVPATRPAGSGSVPPSRHLSPPSQTPSSHVTGEKERAHKFKRSDSIGRLDTEPAGAPIYPKIRKELLEIDTLKYYDLPWKYDSSDPDYIIIMRDMDKRETDLLFEHTSRLRSGTLFAESRKSEEIVAQTEGKRLIDDDGLTELIDACSKGDLVAVKNWHRKEASEGVELGERVTDLPLQAAVHEFRMDIVQYLLQEGWGVDWTDGRGDTALMVAVRNGDADMVELLLGKDADLTIRNSRGKRAIDLIPDGDPGADEVRRALGWRMLALSGKGTKEAVLIRDDDNEPDPETSESSIPKIELQAEEHGTKPRGILKRPTTSFPESSSFDREGVAPLKGSETGAPPGAKWTKIDRRLVIPEALEAAHERFEERDDCVIVLRVLTKEEIQKLADRSQEIRLSPHRRSSYGEDDLKDSRSRAGD